MIFTFEGCIHLNPVAVAIFVHAQGLISNPSVWRDRFVLNSKYFNTDNNLLSMVCNCDYKSGRHIPQIEVHKPQIYIKTLLHKLL